MRAAAFLLLLVSSAVDAQVYRWVDSKGTVNYSNEKPPVEVKAATVNIDAKPGAASPETQDCYTVRCQGERLEQRLARREEQEARDFAQRAAAAPKPPRGLDFRKYIWIQRGMAEGEMLGIAGDADLAVRDGWSIRTYTYFPTVADPFTTIVSVNHGRVTEIERIRKF